MVPNNSNVYLPPVIQIPSALEITAITQANPMVITTSANTDQINNYIVGQLVRLTVPQTYGMYQANGLIGQITLVNGSNFTLNIDSSGFDPFVVPSGNVQQPASLAPSGSRNLLTPTPFQSYNNIGN